MEENKKIDAKKFNDAAKADPDLKQFTAEKKRILFALKMNKGNVTLAARMLRMSRANIYLHRENDPAFKAMFDEIKEFVLDYVESKLFQRIDEGSEISTIYYLNCQGGSRGYRNVQKVDHSTNGKDLPAPQPQMVFLSASDMSQEQIDKLIEQQNGAHSNDFGT